MQRFADARTEAVFRTGFARRVPLHVGRKGQRILQLLHDAHELRDVRIVGTKVQWNNYPGRYGVRVDGKWHVTYTWAGDARVMEMRLERR